MAANDRTGGLAAEVTADDVIAFRLRAHHLDVRRPHRELLDAAGACGVQNSPPGSAPLALHARVEDVTSSGLDRFVETDKSLLQSWSMRGAPFYFPAADAAVYTAGVLPPTETGRLHLIGGVEPALRQLGLGLDEAVDLAAEAAVPVLSGRRLAIGPLGTEVAERVAANLTPSRRRDWNAPGPYAADQPLGEAVVHFCVRILALRGLVCLAPRSGNTAPFTLLAEWLGGPPPHLDPPVARAELLRRYLHCYSPSTRADFAGWLGVRTGDVTGWWDRLSEELVPVTVAGRRNWLLAADLDALRSPRWPRGVRLLPPRDPYTQQRDREIIVDKEFHRRVWKTVGEPGTVLADGRVAGIWRPRKSGRRLTLTVEAFTPLPQRIRERARAEAEEVAVLRGADTVTVDFDDAA